MFHPKAKSKLLPDYFQKSYSSCSVSAKLQAVWTFYCYLYDYSVLFLLWIIIVIHACYLLLSILLILTPEVEAAAIGAEKSGDGIADRDFPREIPIRKSRSWNSFQLFGWNGRIWRLHSMKPPLKICAPIPVTELEQVNILPVELQICTCDTARRICH